jgi:DNA-directed RNA polymerase specialized sigma24 family protein
MADAAERALTALRVIDAEWKALGTALKGARERRRAAIQLAYEAGVGPQRIGSTLGMSRMAVNAILRSDQVPTRMRSTG